MGRLGVAEGLNLSERYQSCVFTLYVLEMYYRCTPFVLDLYFAPSRSATRNR